MRSKKDFFSGYIKYWYSSRCSLKYTGKDRRWLGTKICNYGMLKRFTTEQLRDSKQKELMVRVADGGWHFSYMGGGKDESVEDRVKYKIRARHIRSKPF